MSLPSNSKRKVFDGRYEILSIVGRGADSVVYHARHITGAAQEVAIKVLINRDGTSTLTDKLRREALTLVSCRHKYVVRLDDFHSIKDLCYLSMEYAAHGDLLKYIATLPDKRLPAEQLELFLKQSLEALDFVHATGVVHRDLKPENILVLNDKEIRLADFGLALLPGDEVQLEELQKAVGSFDYLAPEVLDGIKYDTVSDLYSLGVCFYEAATGKHPFAHAPIAERRDARQDSRIVKLSEAAPNLPPQIAAVISTLIRFSARDRFQSAYEALRALEDPQFSVANTAVSEDVSANAAIAVNSDSESPFDLFESEKSIEPPPPSNQATPLNQATPASSTVNAPNIAANSDQIENRPSNPTEKIDLERIKEIIARDSERRSGSTGTADSLPIKAKTTGGATKGSTTRGMPLFANALIRFVGVALAFALLTVGGLYGYHYFTKSRFKTVQAPATTQNEGVDTEAKAVEAGDVSGDGSADGEAAQPLNQLSAGVYPGVIQGLFPGASVPMALMTDPQQHKLTLLVGLEGWVPTTITIPPDNSPESESPTFRSNGLILKFNQESSSAAITGTVIDVVTGDAGTWRISK